jgi:predicted nucleic acid-binding protein
MIVVDTSVIVKFAVPEVRSDMAARLRNEALVAPSIWQAEIGNALWRKVQTKELAEPDALSLLRALFAEVVITLQPDESSAQDALKIAIALRHPIYDCLFLETAVREGTVVITDDSRFAGTVRRHGKWAPHIKLLSET